MKVKDLISTLQTYDENDIVVFQNENSMYADYVAGCRKGELRSFYGADKQVVVITSDGQAGAV